MTICQYKFQLSISESCSMRRCRARPPMSAAPPKTMIHHLHGDDFYSSSILQQGHQLPFRVHRLRICQLHIQSSDQSYCIIKQHDTNGTRSFTTFKTCSSNKSINHVNIRSTGSRKSLPSQPPMCLPAIKTLGTVRCPVNLASAPWIALPSPDRTHNCHLMSANSYYGDQYVGQ